MTTDVAELDRAEARAQTQGAKALAQARALTITDAAEHEAAVTFLGALAQARKTLTEARLFFTKPLNDQLRAINERFKTLATPLEEADQITRTKVLAWTRAQEQARADEEARRRQKHAAQVKEARADAGDEDRTGRGDDENRRRGGDGDQSVDVRCDGRGRGAARVPGP